MYYERYRNNTLSQQLRGLLSATMKTDEDDGEGEGEDRRRRYYRH